MADGEKKVMADEIDKEPMKYENENLKIALEAANNALKVERNDRRIYEALVNEAKARDRKVYEDRVENIKNHCKNFFTKLNDEHEAKLKVLEEEYDKNLRKLQQLPSQPTLCDQSLQTLPVQLVNRSQQTAPGNFSDNSRQTPTISFADLSVQTEPIDEKLGPDSAEIVAVVALQAQVEQLKKEVAELVFQNNRYHLAISNCTFCASDDADTSDVSSFDAPIRASTPVPSPLPSSDSALQPSPIPSLMSLTFEDRRQAEVKTVEKSKDRTFIARLTKTLTKLELKYATPEHKRKKRLFTRKQKTNPIVPRELASIYHTLAAPEPEAVAVPEPFPHVRWNDVRFKPALPTPESCPIYSCSQDPKFYQEEREYRFGSLEVSNSQFVSLTRQCGRPFGALPGYLTSQGVVAIPTTPVGGFVYCPDAKKWVLYAEPRSSPSVGGGTRRGGASTRRRKG